MPNWNNNSVIIRAPLAAVKAWLIETGPDEYHFNMHMLFPESVPAEQAVDGIDNCDELTGSKRTVLIEYCDGDERSTSLGYDSARTPNNGTLQRLHELTGWEIENEYEEGGLRFAGRFICRDGECQDIELEYLPTCEQCCQRKPEQSFSDEGDDLICAECREQQ